MAGETLLEEVLAGVKAFALGFGTCPYHLFGLQRGEREGVVVSDLPSVNHPDVFHAFDPYSFQVAVYHPQQSTALSRAEAIFDQFDLFKRSYALPVEWALTSWRVYKLEVDPPVDLGTVTIDGNELWEVVMTVRMCVKVLDPPV